MINIMLNSLKPNKNAGKPKPMKIQQKKANKKAPGIDPTHLLLPSRTGPYRSIH